jgi:hypothetical protein
LAATRSVPLSQGFFRKWLTCRTVGLYWPSFGPERGIPEALDGVCADIAEKGCYTILCLGDVVGYGPDPKACLDRVMGFDLTIMGNHDHAAFIEPGDSIRRPTRSSASFMAASNFGSERIPRIVSTPARRKASRMPARRSRVAHSQIWRSLA